MTTRMGGQPQLRVLAVGDAELIDLVASQQDGGTKLTKGLAEKVADDFDGKYKVELEFRPGASAAELIDDLAGLQADPPDVVILSLLPDIVGEGRLDVESFRASLRALCAFLKEAGSYVLIANVSTFDRADTMTNYFGSSGDSPSLRAHKVASTILDLSNELGISVIDSDRLLAEIGAHGHVEGLGSYSAEASGVIRDEIYRIMADYGFFEERPLLAQAGAKQR
ncbi:MAG: hypothetical protein ACR2NT_14545 [Acidimicrobiia bacterium]|nr:hypothetical protein [Actinomycetota bacterium]